MDENNDNEDIFSATQPFSYSDQPASPDPEGYDSTEFGVVADADNLYQQSYPETQPFSAEAQGRQHGGTGICCYFILFTLHSSFRMGLGSFTTPTAFDLLYPHPYSR